MKSQRNGVKQETKQLTFKKLSTEANSHMDRRLHLGNCAGSGGATSCVTILLLPPLHCSFCCTEDSSKCCCCSCFFGFCFRSITASCCCCSLAAARIVQARDGRLLLLTGGVWVRASASFREIGEGEGCSRDMAKEREIERVYVS